FGEALVEEPVSRTGALKDALRGGPEQLGGAVEAVELDENSARLFGAAVPHRGERAFSMAATNISRDPNSGFQAHLPAAVRSTRYRSEFPHDAFRCLSRDR